MARLEFILVSQSSTTGLFHFSQPKTYSYIFSPLKLHLSRAYDAPDTVLSTSLPLSALILEAIPGGVPLLFPLYL